MCQICFTSIVWGRCPYPLCVCGMLSVDYNKYPYLLEEHFFICRKDVAQRCMYSEIAAIACGPILPVMCTHMNHHSFTTSIFLEQVYRIMISSRQWLYFRFVEEFLSQLASFAICKRLTDQDMVYRLRSNLLYTLPLQIIIYSRLVPVCHDMLSLVTNTLSCLATHVYHISDGAATQGQTLILHPTQYIYIYKYPYE